MSSVNWSQLTKNIRLALVVSLFVVILPSVVQFGLGELIDRIGVVWFLLICSALGLCFCCRKWLIDVADAVAQDELESQFGDDPD